MRKPPRTLRRYRPGLAGLEQRALLSLAPGVDPSATRQQVPNCPPPFAPAEAFAPADSDDGFEAPRATVTPAPVVPVLVDHVFAFGRGPDASAALPRPVPMLLVVTSPDQASFTPINVGGPFRGPHAMGIESMGGFRGGPHGAGPSLMVEYGEPGADMHGPASVGNGNDVGMPFHSAEPRAASTPGASSPGRGFPGDPGAFASRDASPINHDGASAFDHTAGPAPQAPNIAGTPTSSMANLVLGGTFQKAGLDLPAIVGGPLGQNPGNGDPGARPATPHGGNGPAMVASGPSGPVVTGPAGATTTPVDLRVVGPESPSALPHGLNATGRPVTQGGAGGSATAMILGVHDGAPIATETPDRVAVVDPTRLDPDATANVPPPFGAALIESLPFVQRAMTSVDEVLALMYKPREEAAAPANRLPIWLLASTAVVAFEIHRRWQDRRRTSKDTDERRLAFSGIL